MDNHLSSNNKITDKKPVLPYSGRRKKSKLLSKTQIRKSYTANETELIRQEKNRLKESKIGVKQDIQLKLHLSNILEKIELFEESNLNENSVSDTIVGLRRRLNKELSFKSQSKSSCLRRGVSDYAKRLESNLNFSIDQVGKVNQLKGLNNASSLHFHNYDSSEMRQEEKEESSQEDLAEEVNRINSLKSSFKQSFPESNDKQLENQESRVIEKKENIFDSLSDGELIEGEKLYEETSPYIIPRKSMAYLIFELLLLISVVLSLTVFPLHASFYESRPIFETFELFIDSIFILDIFLSFIVEIKDENGVKLTQVRETAERYFKSYFVLDLIGAIPTQIFSKHNVFDYLNKLFRVFRFSRISKRTKTLGMLHFWNWNKRDNNFSSYKLLQKVETKRFTVIVFFFFIFVHLSSCLFISLGNFPISSDQSWIDENEMTDANFVDVYFASIYFCLATILGIGYGDITSQNYFERIFNIFLLTIGVMFFSIIITSLSLMFHSLDMKAVIIKNKLEMLKTLNNEYNIEEKLKLKLAQSIKKSFTHKNVDRLLLISSLPRNFKIKIINSVYKNYINSLKFLKYQSNEFMQYVLPLLTNLELTKHESLLKVGEFFEECYLVYKGNLSFHLGDFYDGIELARLHANYHFGEILMHLNEQSPYEIKSRYKNCSLLILKKKDYGNIYITFPKAIKTILYYSIPFLEKIEKRRTLIMKLYEYATSKKELETAIKLLNFYTLDFQFSACFDGKSKMIDNIEEIIADPLNLDFFEIICNLKTVVDPKLEMFRNYLEDNFEIPDMTKQPTKESKRLSSKRNLVKLKKAKTVKPIEMMAKKLIDYSRKNSNLIFHMENFNPTNNKEVLFESNKEIDAKTEPIDLTDLKKQVGNQKDDENKKEHRNKLIEKSKSIFGIDYKNWFKSFSEMNNNHSNLQDNNDMSNLGLKESKPSVDRYNKTQSKFKSINFSKRNRDPITNEDCSIKHSDSLLKNSKDLKEIGKNSKTKKDEIKKETVQVKIAKQSRPFTNLITFKEKVSKRTSPRKLEKRLDNLLYLFELISRKT